MKQQKNKKYIITDFDGVLNSYKEGSYKTNTNETYGPSKTICQRLRNLCEKIGARIIISSNWRKFDPDGQYTFGGTTVTNPLKKVYEQLGDLIDGTLPPIRHTNKAETLILWLEENEDVKNWVILDDDPREGLGTTYDMGIKDHYIQTDPEFGITDNIITKIETMLS